jgi:O-Antigen ligase
VASLALMAAIPFLPASFTERMGTITAHEGDQSASTRVAVWKWTIDFAKEHPLGGGFDAYRSNSFTYQMRKVTGTGAGQKIEYQTVTESARAYHSSYFELLGEQGYVGLGLWLVLQLLGLWHMERLRWRFGKRSGQDGPDSLNGRASWQWGLATALQQAHVVYLVGAAFVGIGYQPFLFMLIGLQCALWSYVKRTEAPRRTVWSRRNALLPQPQAAE